MNKAMKWVLISAGALVGVFVVGGLLAPRTWTVGRTRVIDAPPGVVHGLTADLARWPAWSPFDAADPAMVVTLSTQTQGVGAWRSWKSEEMGDGRMEIVKSDPGSGVEYSIEVGGGDPFSGRLVYEGAGPGRTRVTWVGDGDSGWNPLHRWFGLLMEPMIGPYFERGLAKLEEVAEADFAASKK